MDFFFRFRWRFGKDERKVFFFKKDRGSCASGDHRGYPDAVMDNVGISSPDTFFLTLVSTNFFASGDLFSTRFCISPDACVRWEILIFL